jgi:putative YphP/YqiW family bacilliredoxin
MFERSIPSTRGPMYDPVAVQPMRDELTFVGIEELLTPDDVDRAVRETPGTMLVLINSVCGCAAGSARPGVTRALQHAVIPDRFVTVFAGMERDAVDRMRAHFGNHAPSSPSIALLKDGVPVHVLPRYEIEGRDAAELAQLLTALFERHCSRPGPSVDPERYAALEHARMCGSQIPRLN